MKGGCGCKACEGKAMERTKLKIKKKINKGILMAKICPKGIAGKAYFDKYPSAYANMAASKYCKDLTTLKEASVKNLELRKKIMGELAKWRRQGGYV